MDSSAATILAIFNNPACSFLYDFSGDGNGPTLQPAIVGADGRRWLVKCPVTSDVAVRREGACCNSDSDCETENCYNYRCTYNISETCNQTHDFQTDDCSPGDLCIKGLCVSQDSSIECIPGELSFCQACSSYPMRPDASVASQTCVLDTTIVPISGDPAINKMASNVNKYCDVDVWNICIAPLADIQDQGQAADCLNSSFTYNAIRPNLCMKKGDDYCVTLMAKINIAGASSGTASDCTQVSSLGCCLYSTENLVGSGSTNWFHDILSACNIEIPTGQGECTTISSGSILSVGVHVSALVLFFSFCQ